MKICLTAFCLFFINIQNYAQFTTAQKDSVLATLGYSSVSYSFNISFVPDNYKTDDTPNPYNNLSETAALAKATHTYKDAGLYKYLCLDFYTKKDRVQAEKYFYLATKNYDEWFIEEPKNSEPFCEAIGLLYGTQSYALLTNILEEGLKRFPEDKEALGWAAFINLTIFQDLAKTQDYIDKLLALEAYNLTACTYQIMLYQYKYILALNQNQIPPTVDISIVEKALAAKPKQVAYQHLYHFAHVMRDYATAMGNFMKEENGIEDYKKLFNQLSKEQTKEFEEAEKFFKSQVSKQKKARATMLNSLAFISLFLNKPKEAQTYYQTLYNENKELSTLESLILLNLVEKHWQEAEKFLELAIKEHQNIKAYSLLLSIFDRYDKNEPKKLAVLKRLESLSTTEETRNVILATWYLKEKNIEKASAYCKLLSPETSEACWRNLALAVLKEDTEGAKSSLDKILSSTPNDKDAINIKKMLNF